MRSNRRRNWFIKRIALGLAIAAFAAPVAQAKVDEGPAVQSNGFQARISYRHRSKYEGEVIALFQNLAPTLTYPDDQVDAQIGYTFQPGSRFNGLGILLQVSNLLDSPYRTYIHAGSAPVLERAEKYGRSWLLGASYHF